MASLLWSLLTTPFIFPLTVRPGQKFQPLALSTITAEEQSEKASPVVTPLTLTQLDNASDDDDDEGGHLGIGENVLHTGAPLHVGRIDECQ